MKYATFTVSGLFSLMLLLITAAAQADTETRYNQIHLQAQQSESVGNDTMHVTLNAYAEAKDPVRVAEQINADMTWALELAGQRTELSVSSGGYQTYPVYRENILKGWRGQQTLELEGNDTKVIGQLVGQLQEKLQVKNIRFSVSDETRERVENRLIGLALDAFKARARIVGDNLGASGYRIVELSINSASQRPPMPYQVRMAAAPMEADSAIAVEAGESDIRVTVNGTLELTLP